MKQTSTWLIAVAAIATMLTLLDGPTVSAQFMQRPGTGSSVQYIPGQGVVRQQRYFDPTNNSTTTVTHGYYGSNIQRTFGNPVIRTIYVDRWVWTPYGMQLVRQPVNVPIYR